jgi:hypothetical protein
MASTAMAPAALTTTALAMAWAAAWAGWIPTIPVGAVAAQWAWRIIVRPVRIIPPARAGTRTTGWAGRIPHAWTASRARRIAHAVMSSIRTVLPDLFSPMLAALLPMLTHLVGGPPNILNVLLLPLAALLF